MKNSKLHFAILAVDVLLFTISEKGLLLKLIKVDADNPFSGKFALPGGLIRPEENAEQAVVRIIRDKAKVSAAEIYREQLSTFSDIDRDPRGRVVSVAYLAVIAWENLSESERQNDELNQWQTIKKIKNLAYDHDQIFQQGLLKLARRVQQSSLAIKFLPAEFTLSELQAAVEVAGRSKVDKRNFQKKTAQLKWLRDTGKVRLGQASRPAKLYRSASKKLLENE